MALEFKLAWQNHKKKIIIFLIAIVLLVTAVPALYIYLNFQKNSLIKPTPEANPQPSQTSFFPIDLGTPPAELQDIFNILLLGQGGAGHSGGSLTDTLILVRVNTQNQTISLISVPRDIWVSVPGLNTDKDNKINAVYALAKQEGGEIKGINSLKKAVAAVTGLKVDYLVFIDFQGLIQAIDILGGITVNVPKSFDDYYYPLPGKEDDSCNKSPEEIASLSATMSGFLLEKQFKCRYEHLHFEAGPQQLTGQQALKFVRSRHSDQHGGDFARAQRQQALLVAIKNKLISLNALDNILPFFNQLSHTIRTDINNDIVLAIAKLVYNLEDYENKSIILSTENVLKPSQGPQGQFILIPQSESGNWQETQFFVQQNLSPAEEN
jgi:polyisoprenyl-teichoic acid--peptidoglycan teichoic acid transferase